MSRIEQKMNYMRMTIMGINNIKENEIGKPNAYI